jgi:prepilin-type N-terminal cleavage/methylation domain-containing protein
MKLSRNYGLASSHPGFTLTELVAVVAILGTLALLIVPRLIGHDEESKRTVCATNRAEIELQVKLWRRNQGSYPAADLNNIGSNPAYFPNGLPVCPGNGTAYTIDTTTGLITGHAH